MTDSSSDTPPPPPGEKDNPVWSLVLWGGGAALAVGYGLWCILDGWLSDTVEESTKTFSQWMTPVSFAAALWCLWRGVREYQAVKAKVSQGQGGPAATPPSGDEPAKKDGGA